MLFLTLAQDYVAYNLIKSVYECILPLHYSPSYAKQNDIQAILDM